MVQTTPSEGTELPQFLCTLSLACSVLLSPALLHHVHSTEPGPVPQHFLLLPNSHHLSASFVQCSLPLLGLQAPVLQDNNGFIHVTRTTHDLLFPLPASHLPMAPTLPGYCTGTSNNSYKPCSFFTTYRKISSYLEKQIKCSNCT